MVISVCDGVLLFFFCKQKTAYEMRISDWSSDVCSSDLVLLDHLDADPHLRRDLPRRAIREHEALEREAAPIRHARDRQREDPQGLLRGRRVLGLGRSEEHTSELQSLMRNSYAVFCLKKIHNQLADS